MTQNAASGRSRRCADCNRPIDNLPKHFEFCRLCFSRRPESTQPEQRTPHSRGSTDKALQTLIAERLDELGIGPFTASRIAGIPQDTIRNVLRGQSPKYGNLLKICDALHLRLTIEPIEGRDAAPRSPTTESKESTEGPKNPATGRQAAKEDVRATYDTSRPRQEIVDHLRGVPKEIIAEVIDEMLNERSHEDAEELREMAFDAGYEIY